MADTSAWDGAASNWPDASSYCSSCLIDLNPSGQEKTKDKCKLPIRKHGSNQVNRRALIAATTGARGLPAVDAPAVTKKQAANRIIRLYPSVVGKPAPDSIYRIAGKNPPASKAMIYKATDGTEWFIGFYSNKFMDRQGDIITNDSHQEYAEWVNKMGIKPPIILAHQPQYPVGFHFLHYLGLISGKISPQKFNENLKKIYKATILAETERVISFNGFSMVIGKVVNHQLADVIKNSKVKWGMSHGFLPIGNGGNIIEKYRTFEFSVLPIRLAANSFTPIGFRSDNGMSLQDQLKKLSEEDRKALKDALGTIEPEAIEEASEDAMEALESILPHKALDEEGQNDLVGVILKALDVEGLHKSLKAMATKIKEQDVRIEELAEKLQEKQKEIDELVADELAPDWNFFDKIFADRPEDEGVIEQVKENLPSSHKEKSDHELQWGFWDLLGVN